MRVLVTLAVVLLGCSEGADDQDLSPDFFNGRYLLDWTCQTADCDAPSSIRGDARLKVFGFGAREDVRIIHATSTAFEDVLHGEGLDEGWLVFCDSEQAPNPRLVPVTAVPSDLGDPVALGTLVTATVSLGLLGPTTGLTVGLQDNAVVWTATATPAGLDFPCEAPVQQ